MAAGLSAGTAYLDIAPRLAKDFGAQLGRSVDDPIKDSSEKVGGSLSGLAGKVAGLAAGAFAAKEVFGFARGAYAAASESNKIAAQTEAAIKSTGGAAMISADQIGALAESISRKTGVDDEAIQSGQNLLLTFTNVKNGVGAGNDIFNQATATLVDMAAALGGDASSNAIQLGKALNDPVAGVSALSRVGVTFTEDQKKVIKSLVDTGDTAGAQKIILAELGKEFGGSAAAQATSADKLKVTFGNLQEDIGKKVVPMIEKLAAWFSVNLPVALDWAGARFNDLKPTIETIIDVVASVGEKVVWLGERTIETVGWIVDHWNQVKPVITIVAGLILTVMIPQWVAAGVAAVTSAATQVIAWLSIQATTVAVTAVLVAQMVIQIGKWVWMGIEALANAAVVVAAWVLTSAAAVAAVVVSLVQFGIMAAQWVAAGVVAMANAVIMAAAWVIALGPIALLVAAVIAAVALIILNWDKVKGAALAVWEFVKEKFNWLVDFVKGVPGKIADAASGMWDGIKGAFKSALNWVIEKWNSLEFKIPGFKVGPVGFDGFTLGLPDIPKFHQGGRVPGGPGDEILAILAGGERVLRAGEGDDGAGAGGRDSGGPAAPIIGGDLVLNAARMEASDVAGELYWLKISRGY